MAEIKFGTDGWRAVVGEDFNQENVLKVTNAIAKYVFDSFGIDKKIIIGYDPRNMADIYSKLTADIISGYGLPVEYSSRVVPTPVLAYCAKEKKPEGACKNESFDQFRQENNGTEGSGSRRRVHPQRHKGTRLRQRGACVCTEPEPDI